MGASLICASVVPAQGQFEPAIPARAAPATELTAGALRLRAALGEAWRWNSYSREDGLNSNSVTALLQASTNEVYAATNLGVCRYDLWQWDVFPFPAGNPAPDITTIAESLKEIYALGAGVLWRLLGEGVLEPVYRGQSLFLARGRFGELFLLDGGERRHFKIRREALSPLDPEDQPLLNVTGEIRAYAVAGDGRHWIATTFDLFTRDLSRKRWKRVERREVDPRLGDQVCVRFFRVEHEASPRRAAGDPIGGEESAELWGWFVPRDDASTETGASGILARLDGEVWRPASAPDRSVTRILRLHDGIYVATTEDGRVIVSPDGRDWETAAELGIGSVALAAEIVDTSGVVWFRVGPGGIAVFDPESRRWSHVETGHEGVHPSVLSLIETSGGDVFAGMDSAVVLHERSGRIQSFPFPRVTGLAEDGEGRVWITSNAFLGAHVYDGINWHRVTAPGLRDHRIARIVKDWRGELWFLPHRDVDGPSSAIFRHSVLTGSQFETVSLEGGRYAVNDLLRLRTGELWLATDRGVFRGRFLSGEEVGEPRFVPEQQWDLDDGLLSSATWSVAEGSDGSIWVCYPDSATGVSRIRGDEVESFREISSAVWSIRTLGDDLWFGTDRGLTRFDGECFYDVPVGSAGDRWSGVWPVFPSVSEPGTLLIGTHGQGVWRYRPLEGRRPPRFTHRDLPNEIDEDGVGTFSWGANDHRGDTPPGELLYRTRVDNEPWSVFSHESSLRVGPLAAGDHVLEVEVRDRDGNSCREPIVHRFSVAGFAPSRDWVTSALLAVAAIVGLAALAIVLRWSLAHRRRQTRYRALFASYPHPLFVLDAGGRVIDFNGNAAESLGIDPARLDDVVGRPLTLLPFFAHRDLDAPLRMLAAGEPFSIQGFRPNDADERIFRLRGFTIGGGQRTRVVVVVEETREARVAALRERDRRLESLQGLSRRLSRDLRGILDHLDAFLGSEEHPPSVDDRLLERLTEAQELTDRLALFCGSANDSSEPEEEIDLNALLQSLVDAETASRGGVRVDFRAQVGLWPVRAQRNRLSAAFEAILRNAREAMATTGTLTVRTSNTRLVDDPGGLLDGAYVEVRIRDSGPGMNEPERERALEPFFTTKLSDGNSGIGLSIAYGAVRGHGGDLRLKAATGAGTEVVIYLAKA